MGKKEILIFLKYEGSDFFGRKEPAALERSYVYAITPYEYY